MTTIRHPKSGSKSCARKPGRRASLPVAASTLRVVQFRENRATTVSRWSNRRSGHGKFHSTFSSAESAGMSAVIAIGAIIFHHVDLARAAMWLAAIAGAILSPILLIMDLGRPHLFLNMLRVFKHRSAMSMGAWILTAFGACAVPGLIALELHAHQIFPGTLDQLLRVAAGIFIFGSAIFGTLLATYTGVLIGATAIPAWFLHRTLLPIHFGTAGLGSAAACWNC